MLWARRWQGPRGKRAHHRWIWISLAGRSSRSLHPGQHQITLQENQMTWHVQRQWNSSIQQQTFLRWHTQVENQIPKLSKQTTAVGGNCLQFTCSMRLDKSRREMSANNMERPQNICQNRELLSMPGHWTCLGNQRKPTIPSASQTKPTTEVPKHRQHPHQSMLQSHPFRSLQKTVWTDNNHGNKQEPTTRQNLPTTLPSSATCRSNHQKGPNIDWTTATQQRSQSSWTSQGQFQQRAQQKENNLLLHQTFQHLVWTSPLNHQICQRQIQSPMVDSACVLPHIYQSQRNLSRRSV